MAVMVLAVHIDLCFFVAVAALWIRTHLDYLPDLCCALRRGGAFIMTLPAVTWCQSQGPSLLVLPVAHTPAIPPTVATSPAHMHTRTHAHTYTHRHTDAHSHAQRSHHHAQQLRKDNGHRRRVGSGRSSCRHLCDAGGRHTNPGPSRECCCCCSCTARLRCSSHGLAWCCSTHPCLGHRPSLGLGR